MAGKIFINYRRDDIKGAAAHLRDRLAQTFGNSNVFMDVNISPGQRFEFELDEALTQTDIFISVIGPQWMDLLLARTGTSEQDYVRKEIAAAVKKNIHIIPVLMDRGQLPNANALPADICDLVRHKAHNIEHESFNRDTDALIQAIKAIRRTRPSSFALWKSVVLATLVAAGVLFATRPWGTVFQLASREPPKEVVSSQEHYVHAESRVVIEAPFANNAQGHSFLPGAGKSEWFKDCSNCPEMVVVPGGSFTMGSPENEPERFGDEDKQHVVRITKPFAVGRFQVTFIEWDACVADGGCDGYKPEDEGWGRGLRPVINVNWEDAKGYIAWLSRKTGAPYRLLSEAEREYVTRAGTTGPFWWGWAISPERANYDGNFTYAGGQKGEHRRKTLPVKSFGPNPWGLYQVHGNVWEWVEDCWSPNYNGAPDDGAAWKSGDCNQRLLRGGAWNLDPRHVRAAVRYGHSPEFRNYSIGFRVARSLTR